MATIYHLADFQCWSDQRLSGFYRGRDSDLVDGFLHFSTREQIVESAARHRAGEPNLVLLAVDEAMISDIVKWEESRGGALFPHIYGAIPVAAVKWAEPLALDENKIHIFPEMEA